MVFYRLQKSLWVELENYLKMKTRDNIPFTSINMPGKKKNIVSLQLSIPIFPCMKATGGKSGRFTVN